MQEKPAGANVHDEIVNSAGTVVNPDGSNVNYLTGVFKENTGTVTVTITGGTVGDTTPGHEGRNNGRVYGAGRGVSASRADLVASMEYVNDTHVTIGTDGQTSYTAGNDAPYIYGAVFGGGENGHVKTDTHVNIYSGIIGWPLDEGATQQYKTSADGASKNPFRGHVFGGGRGVDPLYHSSTETRSSTAGRVYGHTNVTIPGGVVRRAIYGGGLLASVGVYRLAESDLHIIDKIEDEVDGGKATITISGGYIGNVNADGTAVSGTGLLAPGDNNGHVFGSSCGMVADNYTEGGVAIDQQYRQMGYSHSTEVNISGGHLFGSVFGSGENGHVWEDSRLNISGGEIGSETSTLIYSGNVYGSGRGVDHPHEHISETAGKVRGNTTVNITGGTVWRDVYGGGSLASVGEEGETGNDSDIHITDNPLTTNPYPYYAGLTRVYIHGTSDTPEIHGSVYGSGRGVASSNTEYRQAAYVKNTLVTVGKAHVYNNVFGGGNAGHVRRNTVVDILDQAKVDGNVYGGGAGSLKSPTAGLVNHDVTVNIKGGLIGKDVYGGGAIANTNTHDKRNNPSLYADGTTAKAHASTYGNPSEDVFCKTEVNLTGGIILGNAYGGGQGVIPDATATEAEIANAGALVRGNVTVTLNGTAFHPTTTTDDQGNNIADGGRVFGCNNLNGTPQGTVLVHVLQTKGVTQSGETYSINNTKPALDSGTYEVQAVYGGGNLAAYEPWKADATGQYATNHSAADRPVQVVIDGCDLTSIEYVYGGGNAAATPSTDVMILGAYEIGNVFGGGNGKDRINKSGTWEENPGADVGLVNSTDYGTGKADTYLMGGYIHSAFGGSNTKGSIRESAEVHMDEAKDGSGKAICPLQIDEVYGGGNEAYLEGGVSLDLGCITRMKALYGGAKAAGIGKDVVLTDQRPFFAPRAIQVSGANIAEYKRTLTPAYGTDISTATVVLPFTIDITNGKHTNQDGTGSFELYQLDSSNCLSTGNDVDLNQNTDYSAKAHFVLASGSNSVANKPYMVKVTSASGESKVPFVVHAIGAKIEATPTSLTGESGSGAIGSESYSFQNVGTFSGVTLKQTETPNIFYFAKNALYNIQSLEANLDLYIQPFRAYYSYTSGSPAKANFLEIVFGANDNPFSETTGITSAESQPDLAVTSGHGTITIASKENNTVNISALNGMQAGRVILKAGETKTVNVPAGLYVVNGVKIVVK